VSCTEEHSYWPEVEGTIPPALVGTLFRNGPGRFERGGKRYAHMLDGDGLVTRFSFLPADEEEEEEKGGGGAGASASSPTQPTTTTPAGHPHPRSRPRGARVHFTSRFVRTAELAAEEYAGRVLFRSTFGTAKAGGPLANAFDMKLKNPANTHVVAWGGRLLALWEAGPPHELDPATLATRPGPATLGGLVSPGSAPSTTGSPRLDAALGLGSALTAHPHVAPPPKCVRAGWEDATSGDAASDPVADRRLVTWAWRSHLRLGGAGGLTPDLEVEVAEFGGDWARLGGAKLTLPGAAFNPHDAAVSLGSIVFFQTATAFNPAPYIFGLSGPAQCVHIDGESPMLVHVLPRPGVGGRGGRVAGDEDDDAKPITLATDDASFLVHHANAFEVPGSKGRRLAVWSSGWDPAALAALKASKGGMLGSWSVVLSGRFDAIPFSKILCHTLDLDARTVTRTALYEATGAEHPKVNPAWAGRPTRFVWFTAAAPGANPPGMPGPPQAIMKLDTLTGATQAWVPGPRVFAEEVVFVPVGGVGGPGGAAEDDGWLLAMTFDAATNTSALVILDAAAVSAGPVARVKLSHGVPHGLHGDWTDVMYGPGSEVTYAPSDAEE
jgi:all-trans-8'-apo-beta-carotenal 15,15'-oxygenase